jgi:hypothetical protein
MFSRIISDARSVNAHPSAEQLERAFKDYLVLELASHTYYDIDILKLPANVRNIDLLHKHALLSKLKR